MRLFALVIALAMVTVFGAQASAGRLEFDTKNKTGTWDDPSKMKLVVRMQNTTAEDMLVVWQLASFQMPMLWNPDSVQVTFCPPGDCYDIPRVQSEDFTLKAGETAFLEFGVASFYYEEMPEGTINIGVVIREATSSQPGDTINFGGTFSRTASVGDMPQIEGLSLAPNPVSQFVNLNVPSGDYRWTLVSASGEQMLNGQASGQTTIPVDFLSSGVYFLHVWNSLGRHSIRAIVKE